MNKETFDAIMDIIIYFQTFSTREYDFLEISKWIIIVTLIYFSCHNICMYKYTVKAFNNVFCLITA